MRFLTAGESHGPALIGILEGMPSGLAVDKNDILQELKRRKLGFGRGERQKIETEEFEILSGVRHGLSLGSPITLLIPNKDWDNWKNTMSPYKENAESDRQVLIPRPGHADYTGAKKYQFKDMRNVLERASARETTIRVALGALAKIFLKELNIHIYSRVVQIGSIKDDSTVLWNPEMQNKIDSFSLRMACSEKNKEAHELVLQTQQSGDTLGGVFEVVATALPQGLGSYVQWDRKIDGKIGQAFLSLNAIKGVEVGLGFESASRVGSLVHDSYEVKNNEISLKHNNSGGVIAGMTTGQNLIVKAAMKPLSTLKNPLPSVHLETLEPTQAHYERSDVCAVPAAAIIGEALLALVLLEECLIKFGGDSMNEILERVKTWK